MKNAAEQKKGLSPVRKKKKGNRFLAGEKSSRGFEEAEKLGGGRRKNRRGLL